MKTSCFLSKVRSISFWTLDILNGGSKKRIYSEIDFIITNPNSEKAVKYKSETLDNILRHAVSTTKYYKDYRDYKTVFDFRVIDKNSIRDNHDEFISKSHFTQKRSVTTSGSTGTPLKIVQDDQKVKRNTVDTLYFSTLAGYRLGVPLYYFRFWKAFKKPHFIQRIMHNIIPVDVFLLAKRADILGLLKKIINRKCKVSFLGYASAFDKIVEVDPDNLGNKSIPIVSAIAISESLNPSTKSKFQQYFGTELISRYSNIENGIIAQQPLGNHEYFVINEASYFLEVLELTSDNPVKMGEMGRIVITDLFNYHMPIIRYDTGDLGSLEIRGESKVIANIYGRKIDVLTDTSGNLISHNLVLIVNKYLEIKQCQLIQKRSCKYEFKINIEQAFNREKEFVEEFRKYLGADANITVVYVDEIPLLASGKTRMMVNEML